MALTDTEIKNAKPGGKPVKLFDGGGLFLLVTPAGQKWWRLKYRIAGKEKLLAIGVYPEVGLAAARKKRDEARDKIASGIDPSEAKKEDKRRRCARWVIRVISWTASSRTPSAIRPQQHTSMPNICPSAAG